MPTTKIRNVGQPKIQPNVAAFLKEVKELGLGYTMTSAQRDKHHKKYRKGSSHTHGFACDIGIKKAGGDDMSFIEFMFGKGFDPEGKVDGDFVRPDLSPEAVALFKKHNIRLIDERIGGNPHYHFEAVDSTNAKIVKAGGEANFSTSPRQGNTNKDHYFYGGDSKVFVENDYNTTKEYNDTIVKGSKVNIISNESGIIDTSKTFQVIPSTVIPKGGDLPSVSTQSTSREKFLAIPGVNKKLEQISKDNGFTVDQLLTVIENESNFNPKAKNKKSTATGLIQFMKDTSDDLGVDHGSLIKMNELEQLDVVDKYFKRNHRKGSHPYLTVALPVAARFEPNEIITADSLIEKGLYKDKTREEVKAIVDRWKKDNPVWVNQDTNELSAQSILAYGGVTNKNKAENRAKQQQMLDAGIYLGTSGPNKDGVDGNWGNKSRAGWVKFGNIKSGEEGLKEEYEKYVNEQSGEGVAEENILSYEDYYKQIGEIGSPKARKLKREQLSRLGPRKTKVKEKKEEEEEEVVGKVDEDGQLDLTPSPVAPGTTISEGGEVDFGGQIQKRKDELNKKKEEENKEKEKVYQPKKLVPLESLSDEERAALSNEEREAYGLEPLISDEEKAAQDEEERLRFEKEEEEDMLYSQQQDEKRKTKGKGRDKKVETVMVDKDGDGIPDTIDADAGEPTGGPAPENQLTVSTEEQVVIDEQEKESAIETVETEEMEVLDANGNIKKITVPTVKTPTTVGTEGMVTEEVTTTEDVVEKKPELVKPKLKDFKTSSDYVRARMKYFKSVEDQDELDFDNELDDNEIKEAVDMEQNSTVIDASKRNIFKTNGKTNIFNSVLGVVDDLAKGIQEELNNITKSINNRD